MLQHLGPGQGAVLGDMPHQQQHGTGLFGKAGERGGALTHLGHTAGSGLQGGQEHDLDGIHHQHPWLFLAGQIQDLLHIRLCRQPQLFLGQLEAVRPHGHLGQGFLTGDVETLLGGRQLAQGLQQKGRLASAGVTTNQNGRARHQAATQHPVQLPHAGTDARGFRQHNLVQVLHLGQLPGKPATAAGPF